MLANPYPVVHKGGMIAVAIATPGTIEAVLREVRAITPAKAEAIATTRSSKVGDVRAIISGVGSVKR
jgi:hypothetical protein